MLMEIHQILNNNVVITIDAEGQEFVVMGKGLAFSKKIGDKIDIRDVEKFFVHKINVAGVGMIGEVIKEQRILNNMTRKTLSEGICSPNDIHLIETNKINPPIYVLNALGDKLAIDLFEYYEFFNYKNREKVLKHRGNFERAIKSNDLEMLLEESRLAAQLEDYQKEPFLYDIKINNYIYKVFVKGETEEVIKELEEMLKIESLNIDVNARLDSAVIAR